MFLLQFHSISWDTQHQNSGHTHFNTVAKLCALSCLKKLFWWCPAFYWFCLILHTELVALETCQGWLQDTFPDSWVVILNSASWCTAQIILPRCIALDFFTLDFIWHTTSLLGFATFLLSSEGPPASCQRLLTTQNSLMLSLDLEISLHTLFSRSLMKMFNKTSVSVYPSGTSLLKMKYPFCKTTKELFLFFNQFAIHKRHSLNS